jgi:hypothetical protein
MYADGVRISVSVATIEFAATADGTGTTLTWTEQGAFLDGFDDPDASSLRQGGTEEMLEASPSTWPEPRPPSGGSFTPATIVRIYVSVLTT